MPETRHEPEGAATLFGRKVISKIPETEIVAPALPRRRWVFAGVVGVLTYPFLRFSKAVNKRSFNHKAIRPPGSVAETEFLERCIKCDQCINVCPTNVLQPSALAEGGLEGLWTPVMDFKTGFCQLNCTLCSEVCPEMAIRPKLCEPRHLYEVQDAKCTGCGDCLDYCPAPGALVTYDALPV